MMEHSALLVGEPEEMSAAHAYYAERIASSQLN